MIILAAQTLGSFSKPDPRDLSRRRAFHFSLGFKVSDTEDMLDIVLCRTDHKKVENLRHDFKQDRMYALMNNAYSQASHSQAHHIAGEIHKVHILGQVHISDKKTYIMHAVKDFLYLSRGVSFLKEQAVTVDDLLQQKPKAIEQFSDLASDYIKHLSVDEMIWIMRETDPNNAARYANSHVSTYRHKEGKDVFPDQAKKPCNDPTIRTNRKKASTFSG